MTGLSVVDIDRWSTADVRAVFHAARSRAEATAIAADGLVGLPVFRTWAGRAAEAAQNSIEATRKDLDAHGNEALAVARAADRAADRIDEVKHRLAVLRADAAAAQLVIDPLSNRVVAASNAPGLAARQAELQSRLDAIIGAANAVDEELANAIDMADGDAPIPTDPAAPVVGPDGLTPQQAAADAEQERHQRAAFARVYGRDPVSANDWRMAAALDPVSYQPRNHGVDAEVVAGRFTPQPGRGVVRTNLFIPSEKVQNVAMDFDDLFRGRWFPDNFGDNRGPSAFADMDGSRVSLLLDYDNGVIAVRQNPTGAVDGQRGGARAVVPRVNVLEAADGRITVDYNAYDAYENILGRAAGLTVNGRVTFAPGAGGGVALGGDTTIYPSMETYQYRAGGQPVQLQWNPANSGSEVGPATSLMRHHWVGDTSIPVVKPEMSQPDWELANLRGENPFNEHATHLTAPASGPLPTVTRGR
ncbi:MAG TPA: hypothetical protein VFR27_18840 [Mycobacterium sp.]|nr:hypothetical protein [Mycobacterium sp.]